MFETRNAPLGGSKTADNLADADAMGVDPSIVGHRDKEGELKMTEQDASTGQFIPTSEPVFGKAALEKDAGFVPLPDGTADAEELTQHEGLDEWARHPSAEGDIKTYSGIAELDDNVTLTAEQAAKIVKDDRAAEGADAEKSETDKLRAEVDKLRGVDPEAKAKESTTPEADVEKFMAIPHVKEAFERQTREIETARQSHLTGIAAATAIQEATIFSDFPEIMNAPPDQWENIFRALAQSNPARAQHFVNRVQTLKEVNAIHQTAQAQQAARANAEFQAYAREEDTRFAEMVKGEKNMPAIEAEIPAMLQKLGVNPREWLEAGVNSKFIRSAAAQAILVKAAKYDMMQRAQKAAPARVVPPVQRPGYRGASEDRGGVANLTRSFAANPTTKDAAKLLIARRARSK